MAQMYCGYFDPIPGSNDTVTIQGPAPRPTDTVPTFAMAFISAQVYVTSTETQAQISAWIGAVSKILKVTFPVTGYVPFPEFMFAIDVSTSDPPEYAISVNVKGGATCDSNCWVAASVLEFA